MWASTSAYGLFPCITYFSFSSNSLFWCEMMGDLLGEINGYLGKIISDEKFASNIGI